MKAVVEIVQKRFGLRDAEREKTTALLVQISGDRKVEVEPTGQGDFNKDLRLNSADEINFVKRGD